jgi:membrane protein YqaA with SNARE-associated domain
MIDESAGAASAPQIAVSPVPAKPSSPPVWAGILVVVLIVVVSFWLALNPEWVLRFGSWGYVGAFFVSLVASATIVLPAPGLAVVIAMSTALDPVLLGIVAGLGSAFGELTGYVAGASGRAFVPPHQREQVERLHALTDRYGAIILIVLAAIPFPLFDFAGIVAGMLRMNVVLFWIAIAIGKSIKYILLIWIGAAPLEYLQEHLRG